MPLFDQYVSVLAGKHRMFRDLAINPVAVELMRYMIGRKAARFSSFNSFVKWHGEFPKKTQGLRLSIANYYRHVMVTSQENIRSVLPQEIADNTANPELFTEFAGFNDEFPYMEQSQAVPTAI